jgi:hypothetical protein
LLLAFLFDAKGGAESILYKKGKAHFQHVYSYYNKRAVGIKEWERQRAENKAIDAQEAQEAQARSESLEVEGQEDWRINPFHSYAEFVASQLRQQVPLPLTIHSEVERWFMEPCIHEESTPKDVQLYMLSKSYNFPIITQMARDFLAIPATSSPSERVFSLAGNLISKKRTRIASENVRYVLCLRSWGFLKDDDDEVELLFDENGCVIKPLDLLDVVTTK